MVSAAKNEPACTARVNTMLGMPGPTPRAFGAMIPGSPQPNATAPAAAETHAHAAIGCPASRINDGANVTAAVRAPGTRDTWPSPSNPACTRRSPGSVVTNDTRHSGTMTANTRRQFSNVRDAAIGGPTNAGSNQQNDTRAMILGRSTAGKPCATITVRVRLSAPAPRPWTRRAARSHHTDGANQPSNRPRPNMANPT